MALPGVRTILQDRFYTLSRSDIPDGIRVAAIARRSLNISDDSTLPADYDVYRPRNEQEVVNAFGSGSELHRAYLELASAGAARIDLIPIPTKDSGGSPINADAELESVASGNPLERAFEAVEVAQSDIVVPWGRGSDPAEWESPATPGNDPVDFGFYADNSSVQATSYAYRVAQYCKDVTDRSNPIFAVLGLKPYVGSSNADSSIVASDLNTHLGFSNLVDREADMGDDGQFVSVVAGEVRPSSYQTSWGYANTAATYAGLLSSLDAEIAATGKLLYNLSAIRYPLTRTQQQNLIDKGLVPVALNYSRAAVVVDAQTFSKAASDYTRLSTLRIIFDTVQLIRTTCERYIGQPSTVEHRNALDTAVRSQLRQMIVSGALLDADFEITYVRRENKALIDLVLRPAFEIRNIEITVSVQV